MILEKYYFINHLRNDFSFTINIVILIIILISFLVFYLVNRKRRVNIADLIGRSVFFLIIFFSFFVVANELSLLNKDYKELARKENIDKADSVYKEYFYSDKVFSFLKIVRNNTEKNKTAVLIAPNENDRVWLKYYLYPEIKILKKDTRIVPDYFLVFINPDFYPNASINASFPGYSLVKEISNSEKIYVNNNI